MSRLWSWALDTVPANVPISVYGHSLDASRTHLMPLYLPRECIGALHSFEAPKFADAAYYATYAEQLAGMVCVLNGSDLCAAWPWLDGRYARPQNRHIWLHGDSFAVILPAQWPFGRNPVDHINGVVQARCAALAAQPEAAYKIPLGG